VSLEQIRWRKLGLVYHKGLAQEWMGSYGANPIAGEVDDGRVQVYFNYRDEKNRSHVAWANVDLTEPFAPVVTDVSDGPVLSPGELGTFDDSGVSLGSLVETETGMFLYYIGWNLGVTVPWHNGIGLAIRRPRSATFERYSPAPIMDRSAEDPLTLSYPSVLYKDGLWRMWYGSHTRWGGETEFEHVLKYAESADGIEWRRRAEPVLRPLLQDEYALSRPCVLPEGRRLYMWFCSRGDTYRIYEATSTDGIDWQRTRHEPTLDVSDSGWDSEMTCYPFVFQHRGRYFMLYNGNAYGRDGFGIAIADSTAG